jgi:hypothetical protein
MVGFVWAVSGGRVAIWSDGEWLPQVWSGKAVMVGSIRQGLVRSVKAVRAKLGLVSCGAARYGPVGRSGSGRAGQGELWYEASGYGGRGKVVMERRIGLRSGMAGRSSFGSIGQVAVR